MSESNLIPYKDMESMSAVMAQSGMFGKTREQMLALMLIAQAEGLHPATAAQEYDVIQGRPALKSQAALARFQKSGGIIEWITRTDECAEAKFSHPKSPTPITIRWDVAKATKAKLWGKRGSTGKDTPWITMPGIMLQWRCVAEGVRACYPACLNRMYLVEEVQDFEPLPAKPMRNVTDETPPVEPTTEPEKPTEPETPPEPEPVDPLTERAKAAKAAIGEAVKDSDEAVKVEARDRINVFFKQYMTKEIDMETWVTRLEALQKEFEDRVTGTPRQAKDERNPFTNGEKTFKPDQAPEALQGEGEPGQMEIF